MCTQNADVRDGAYPPPPVGRISLLAATGALFFCTKLVLVLTNCISRTSYGGFLTAQTLSLSAAASVRLAASHFKNRTAHQVGLWMPGAAQSNETHLRQ